MNKITLPVRELKTALMGLSRIISKRATLPVLQDVRIERAADGTTTIGATDLDAFASYRFEEGVEGKTESILVPFASLNTIVKSAATEESITIDKSGPAHALIGYPIGGRTIEQRVELLPVEEWPPIPELKAKPALIDGALRQALLEALQCVSSEETRYVLQGALLDVSDKKCHHIVATDGRQLYSSNSFHIPLETSVIIPDHRFLAWRGFGQDGNWTLRTAKDPSWIQLQSFRWTFTVKAIEGQFPNWRQVVPDAGAFKGMIRIPENAVNELIAVIGKLPCDGQNRPVGLRTSGGKLLLFGQASETDKTTEVEFGSAETSGESVTVNLNRSYLTKALSFGLNEIQIQDALSPVRCADPAGRQMIIMPVRLTGTASAQSQPSSPPPVSARSSATSKRNHPMRNATQTTNGNGAEKQHAPETSLGAALDHIEQVKGSIRSALAGLNVLAGILKQAQREHRSTEKEIDSVRHTLKTLQSVKI